MIMAQAQIGRYAVTVYPTSYFVSKDGCNFANGDTKKTLNKYRTCFNRQKGSYAIASVCLEDAIDKISRKRNKR
jgi:hypothetical protein